MSAPESYLPMPPEAPVPGGRGPWAARAGHEGVLRTAIEAMAAPARRFLFGMCGSWDQAEDMVQEAMLKAWSRRESFDGRSDARTWLFAIVRNHWLDCLRKKMSRTAQSAQPLETAQPLADRHAGPPGQLLQRELAHAVQAAMATLPDEQREALALRESDGLSFAQIAQMLGLPVPTVKSRVRYALLKLADQLQPYRESLP